MTTDDKQQLRTRPPKGMRPADKLRMVLSQMLFRATFDPELRAWMKENPQVKRNLIAMAKIRNQGGE